MVMFSEEGKIIDVRTGEEQSPEEYLNHQAVLTAQAEQMKLLDEIDGVFAAHPDNRAEAEKIVMEKYDPLLKASLKKTGEAITAWIDSIKKAHAAENVEKEEK